jgi:hypothetical protein
MLNIDQCKTVFVTFGDGSDLIRDAAERLGEQARSLGIFDAVLVFDLSLLEYLCADEFGQHSDFIRKNTRGLGYWLWKPLLLKYLLKSVSDGTVLFYADAGCELFPDGIRSCMNQIELCRKWSGVFYRLPYTEDQYTKEDLLRHQLISISHPRLKNQIHATYFLMKKCERSKQLVEDWLFLAVDKNYHYLDDTKSLHGISSQFIEHRHDQSILSCLVHSYRCFKLSYGYHFSATRLVESSLFLKHFIHPIRNKTGESVLIKSSRVRLVHTRILGDIPFVLSKLSFRYKCKVAMISSFIKSLRTAVR